MTTLNIRQAIESDLSTLQFIYNQSVLTETASFDVGEVTLENRQNWWNAHGERFPILVAELNGKVIGYGSISTFNPKPAFAITGEISLYVDKNYRRQGTGVTLLQALIQEATKHKFHSLVSLVTADNQTSILMHERFEFQRVGILQQCGNKFQSLHDIVIFQKML